MVFDGICRAFRNYSGWVLYLNKHALWRPAMKLCFVTSTPLDVVHGSGTFAGISTLARALKPLGAEACIVSPNRHFAIFTLERLWFNEQLRSLDLSGYDAVVGFDMDGYRIADRRGIPHIASIKGVIADELRFERGGTRLSMAVQAACERRHVIRAGMVMTTSSYAARRLENLYGIREVRSIVPELIDLGGWMELFERNPAFPEFGQFTVLCVARFYPRKRISVLLEAAAMLRGEIPGLQVRIVGGGPEAANLHEFASKKQLRNTVVWLGDVSRETLAREYNGCDIFCLPSVQEGFGIVFLEAMAAGKPIVAARAAAVPEVVQQGLLFEPDDPAALAEALLEVYRRPDLRISLAETGKRRVCEFDAPRVARKFLDEVGKVLR
jgi:glycosyltransferase involved in cell wall biosynthesis